MNKIVSAIVVLLFVILVIISTKKHRNSNFIKNDKIHSNSLRGIMAVLIVLSHTHLYFKSLGYIRVFNPFGFIGVTVFFFYSGYGVAYNTLKKGDYLKGYWASRLPKLFVPYWLATFVYVIVELLIPGMERPTFAQVLLALTSVKRILPFSWYVFVIFLWYLVWFLISKISENKSVIIGAVGSVLAIYAVICFRLRVDTFYYKSIVCLFLGVSVAFCSTKAIRVGRVLLDLVMFLLSVFMLWKVGNQNDLSYSLVVTVCSLFFTRLVQDLNCYFSFGGKISSLLGTYSYELYLLQGPCFVVARYVTETNLLIFELVFWTLLVLSSYALNSISSRLIKFMSIKPDGMSQNRTREGAK